MRNCCEAARAETLHTAASEAMGNQLTGGDNGSGRVLSDGADLLAEMLGGTSFGGVERDALGPLLVGLFPTYRDGIQVSTPTYCRIDLLEYARCIALH